MENIWHKLPKPIFIQAPMDDVTDTVFRQVLLLTAPPDLFFSEFTNVDGLTSEAGSKIVERKLKFTKKEHPIIAQLWGNNPENFLKSGRLVKDLGFDGIDINFGCPVHDVIKQGSGGGAIGNITLVREIVQAVLEGSNNLPISIKTRLGIKTIDTENWIGKLLTLPLSAITIHGRTVDEMSKVPAHWDEIHKAVKIRNQSHSQTLIIGNGDIKNREDGLHKVGETGVDGVMIGRGIFHNIYAFSPDPKASNIDIKKRLEVLYFHVKLYEKTWGNKKPFDNLKKYFKIYISGFDGATDMRVQFMKTDSYIDVELLVRKIQKSISQVSI